MLIGQPIAVEKSNGSPKESKNTVNARNATVS